MNQKIQKILNIIQNSQNLNTEEKDSALLALMDANKELEITSFKFEKTDQVKKTTAILLEETIEELEQKRKAVEAQNRELEIETALERVRAKAMAMHNSDDLAQTVDVFFKELKSLDVTPHRCGVTLIDEETHVANLTVTTAKGKNTDLKMTGKLTLAGHSVLEDVYNNWKRQKEFHPVLKGQDIKEYYNAMNPEIAYPDSTDDEIQYGHYFYFKEGGVFAWTDKELPDGSLNIFRKFTSVLSLTYRRYLDLIEAEAQAREAEIELALERVRAKTMAMQKSEELKEVIQVVYEQFVHLNINIEHTGFIVDYKVRDDMHIWLADQKGAPSEVTIPYFDSPHWNSFIEAKEKGKNLFTNLLPFREKNKFYKKLFTFIPDLPEKAKEFYLGCPGLAISTVLLENVGLYIENFSGIPYSDEENALLMRFGKVFQQTYTRFLDLKKSEAQAREAKIEAALERVRSLALGMRNSEEVGNVTDLLFTELTKLSLDVIGCSIVVIDQDNDKMELWRARSNIAVKPFDSTSFAESMDLLKKYMPEWFPIFIKALRKRKNYLIDELSAKRRSQFINAIAEQYKYSGVDKSQLLNNAPGKITTHYIFFKLGYLGLLAEKKLSDEKLSIARRFIDVFAFAYTRFLDIKNAEKQAREAQIEAALERVRSKAMAMHKSDDLTSSVAIVFSELDRLGFTTIRCGIGIFNDKSRKVNVWTTSSNNKTETAHLSGDEVLEGHPLLEKIYDAWENQYDFSYTLKGKELIDYYKYSAKSNLPVEAPALISNSTTQYYHCVMFPAGGLFAFRDEEFSEEAVILMRRFSDVFHLAFTRHLDLKQAEEQNKIILAENERKTVELEEAREMQLSMLPKSIPQFQNLDIAVYMKTATEVGGDYYDFSIKEDGSLNIALGDATGHGMKAGIMVSAMKSIFTTNAPKMSIEDFFNNANSGIKSMNLKRMMMGFTMLNIDKNEFKLINAGMPPIFLYRKKFHAVDEIIAHGMPIGAMNNSIYTISDLSLERGDVLLLMSDGMPELQNDKNEMYGYKRIHAGFEKVAEKNPSEIVDFLKKEVADWINNEDPDDDVTFVVIKVKS